jgi:hypothetical protein
MRKLTLSWLLPLLMLFAQHGAFVHELEHLKSPVQQTHEKKQAADKVCESCLAFSHLSNFGAPPLFAPPLLSLRFELEASEAVASIASDTPTARSRGPPHFL